MKGVANFSEWLGIILDRHSQRFKSEIEIDEVYNFRIFKIVLPLPPLVLNVSENWFRDIRGTTVDFTFVLKFTRKSKLSDNCFTISNANLFIFAKHCLLFD